MNEVDGKMKYYILTFGYLGVKANSYEENVAADKDLSRAEKIVTQVVNGVAPLGITILHAYSFPDGSLDKFARAEDNIFVAKIIQEYLKNIPNDIVRLIDCVEMSPDKDPYKVDCKTLKEYFDCHKA